MKFSISLILLFILVLVELNVAHYNVNLIKNIHHKYKARGVIILSGTDSPSFEKMTIYHEAVIMLSAEGISTLIVNFRQFTDELKVRNVRTYGSLIVIAINTIEEFQAFKSFTKKVNMSHGVWLISFAGEANRNVCELCRNPHKSSLNLRFDSEVLISCCGANRIERWWNIGGNNTKKQDLGRLMDGNHGIEWLSDELVKRYRYSLDGQGLRIAIIKESFEIWEKNGAYQGPLGEIILHLSQAMNFTISETIWENSRGVFDSETSTWSGVIGRVYRREADLGASAFIMKTEQYDVISYTAPLISGNLQLHYRKHDVAYIEWSAYFQALTLDVWMVILGLVLIAPLLLTLIRYRRGSHFFPLLFEHYLHIWGIFCQQGLPEFPNELPSRIVYSSICISSVVTVAAYSSSIISSLATPSHPLFETIEQLVEDGTYKLIMLQQTQSTTSHQPLDQTLRNKWMSLLKPKDSFPIKALDGFEQVCSERVAFYAHEFLKKSLINKIPCEITSLNTGAIANIAMIMPRGSEYLDLVNYHIARMRDRGILARILQQDSMGLNPDEHKFLPVNVQTIAPILLILALGFFIASIIFIIGKRSHSSTKNSDILVRMRKQYRGKNLKKNFRFPRN